MILGEKNALHLECKVFLSAQKKMDEKRTMTGKRIYTGLMGLLLFLAFACTDDRESPGGTNGNPSLVFRMTRASADIINNTQVYLFDGDGATAGQFRQKVPDVTYAADRLTMPVAAGTWDITLVSADGDVNSGLIQPVRGQARSSLKMWETRSVGGSLPSMPELRTAYITGQQVIAGQDNVASETALLSRNVALVKVVIADAGGLDINGTHTMKLTNVPTTLNWEGGLYPNKNNPTVSAEPMTGTFTIHNNTAMAGHQYSDTLRFIVPAHKGTDYLNALPTDTTTSHLKLSVDLASEGGTRFEKTDVVIPRVPRVNGILLVRIFLGGKLDVSTEILNWQDTQLEADLSQTQLYTDKASVGMAFKDTIHVNTNAREYTVEKAPEATWITSVKKLDGNAVEITADLDSYVDNHPRTSYITIYHNRCRISCEANFHIYVIRTPHKLHDKIIKLWDTNNYSLKHRHFNCIIRIINMSKGYFSITFFLIGFTITDKSKNTGCRIIIRLWSRMYPTWLIDNSQITGISTIYFHIVHSTCSIRMHSWLCNLN